ncbi:MAG: S8 family serine peptidase [Deltaproteobacteria bacterium]|nr:S8 family serine peptidase [Deltaproteobacteria bacterium]
MMNRLDRAFAPLPLGVSALLGIVAVISLFLSSDSEAAELPVDRSRTISLQSQVIDTASPLESLPAHLRLAPEDAVSSPYQLVKFPGPVSQAQRDELEKRVERIYAYLPHDAFLVRLPNGSQSGHLDRVPGASWTGAFQPGYKLSTAVLAVDATVSTTARPLILMLQIYPDANLSEVRSQVETLGLGEIVGAAPGNRFSRIRVLVEPASLAAKRASLAQIPEIVWADLEARRVLLNDTTVSVSQAGVGASGATPIFDQGIFGEGQIVGVLDTGIDPDMCYFRDGTLGLPPRNECNGGTVVDLAQRKVIAVDFLWNSECNGGIGSNEWDTQDHGTHVAGTVAGDNLANPLIHDPGDGMAPGAKLVIQDCGFQTDNCADCPGIGCPVVDLVPIFQQAYDQGARIHTNSWGDEENNPVKGRYTAGSQDADEFMWNNKDMLLFFAAGNDGPGTGSIGSPSTGKNVVSVGSTLRNGSANSMSSFSSCGPTQDGRIKPDVTMPGSSIISANSDNNTGSNNCNTKSSSGTSMASPGAAGSAALIRQYFTDGWYPTGDPVPADGFTPSAALLKATLINSAVNMTGTAAIPGNCQGWGRVLLDEALHFGGEARELFVEDDTTGFAQGSSGDTRTFNISVGSSLEPLKVTLAWTDFPAAPLASPTLVNDLDLEISGPTGTFLGNVFSGGVSTGGGSADRLNNVEQVLLANPQVGNYTVTVRSFTVPSGPQPFAVSVAGALTPACSPQAVADAGPDQTITAGQSVTVGTPSQSGHTYSWNPGGATSAQISVSPATTTTYTVTATTSCGSTTDSATITVLPAGCAALEDFESGAGGWTNSGASSCSTGTFVVGTPTLQSSGGVTTQVAGDHTSGSGNAFFSATNTAAGTNDVDGGTCIVESPVYTVTESSDVSIWYFHGQRDAGDDAGDLFDLEISTNGGASYSSIVAVGDVTLNAAWTEATTTVAAGTQVKFRVSVADAPSGGDIVEAGLDDLQICASTGPGNTAPTVNITAPANGSSSTEGDNVNFSGNATDIEDGTLSANLGWTSSLDGNIGSGASFSTSTLSVGSHAITASVTDSGGLSGSDSINITVNANPGNTAPTVNITAPANGSSSTEGNAVNFSGNATDTEDGTLSASLSWASSLDGSIGSGASFSTSALSVGAHTITASVTDSGGLSGSDSVGITVNADTGGSCPAGSLDFNSLSLTSYSNQNSSNGTEVLDGGDTLRLTGNTWVRSTQTFNVTANTVVEFDFTGTLQGEIHAIGFDENDDLNDAPRHFQYWGTQNWTGTGKIDFNPKYNGSGSAQSFSVPVGQSYTGSMFLVFTNDDDANAAADTRFSCVRIIEDTPPPGCVTTDFSAGASGWTNTAASTCSTGAFVVGTPGLQTNGGVTTQVGGDHTSGTGNAFFSATNTSAGANDVDGGTCVVESGTTTVNEASNISIWYFHGQRDAGDDSGDFFSLEISTNGGSSWSTLASAGDVTSNAAWTEATTSVAAGAQVRFRLQVADGPSDGDLIEAGVDDVEICPAAP